ncbi:MAG: GIY-YIG nuclease family protein [Patescibacteria group bacterium]
MGVRLPFGRSPVGTTKPSFIKYYVYILVSLLNGDIYVGSSADVQVRFRQHNQGKVKSTKGYRPWKLLKIQEYESRKDAIRGEKFYKTGQQKEILKQKYGHVAKW